MRGKLALGRLDAVHMLSPVPVAMSTGLGARPRRVDAPMALSVNGAMIGVGKGLAARMRAAGAKPAFMDADAVGRRLIAAPDVPIRAGALFAFPTHAELLHRRLGAPSLAAPLG